jgi:hypothetical protein
MGEQMKVAWTFLIFGACHSRESGNPDSAEMDSASSSTLSAADRVRNDNLQI